MIRALAFAPVVVLLVAGCGGSSSSSEAKKPAARVVADAEHAALGATVVHVTGRTTDDGAPLRFDLWLAHGRAKGRLAEGAETLEAVRIGNVMYVRGNAGFLRRLLGPAAPHASKEWFRGSATSGRLAGLAPLFDLRELVRTTLGQHGKIENRGRTRYGGTDAVEIHDTTEGGSLFVAASGTPYPVALRGGASQGDLVFGSWNSDVRIAAPPAVAGA